MGGSAEAFEIVPLDALGRPNEGAKISLTGRALPHQQPSYKTRQRSSKEEYQGNPEATIQVFGPTFPNTIFVGEFHYRYTQLTINGQAITAYDIGAIPEADAQQFQVPYDPTVPTTPEILQDALETLAISGQPVEVRWSRNIRQGILLECDFKPKRRQDIPWSLEFQWSGRPDVQQAPFVITKFPLDSSGEQTQHVVNLNALAVPPTAVPAEINTTVELALLQLNDLANDLVNAVASTAVQSTSNTTSPAAMQNTAKRAISTLGAIQLATAGLIDGLSLAFVDASQATSVDSAQLIAYANWRAALEEELFAMYRDAWDSQVAFASAIQQTPVAIYKAPLDTDLRDVAVLFGQAPSTWTEFADFNNLDDSAVAAGQTLFIPDFT